MSKTATADDGTDTEDTAAEEQIDEESALQELMEARRRELAQVEEDGEQIKRVVGELVVGNEPNSDVTNELHQILADTLGELHQQEEAVRLPEIIFALWLELDRATGMLVEASEQAQDDDTDNEQDVDGEGDAETVEPSLTGDTELGGQAEGETADDDDEDDDPMATSARMFQ